MIELTREEARRIFQTESPPTKADQMEQLKIEELRLKNQLNREKLKQLKQSNKPQKAPTNTGYYISIIFLMLGVLFPFCLSIWLIFFL